MFSSLFIVHRTLESRVHPNNIFCFVEGWKAIKSVYVKSMTLSEKYKIWINIIFTTQDLITKINHWYLFPNPSFYIHSIVGVNLMFPFITLRHMHIYQLRRVSFHTWLHLQIGYIYTERIFLSISEIWTLQYHYDHIKEH